MGAELMRKCLEHIDSISDEQLIDEMRRARFAFEPVEGQEDQTFYIDRVAPPTPQPAN